MLIGNDARTALIRGANMVADYVAQTMGPGGKIINVLKGNNNYMTKDGATVARDFALRDNPAEQAGVDLIYKAANRTLRDAGDGTTTTTVMAREMMLSGHQRLAMRKLNTNLIAKEMVAFSEIAIKHIEAQSISVSLGVPEEEELILNVGTISANGDREMAKLCLEAIRTVGPEPSSITQVVAAFDECDTMSVTPGMCLPSRIGGEILGPYNKRTLTGKSGQMAIVIVPSLDQELGLSLEMNRLFRELIEQHSHGVLVVAKQPADNLRSYLVKHSTNFHTAFISPTLHGAKYIQLCEDLITLCGAKQLTMADDALPTFLGYARSVDILPDGMTIVEPQLQGGDEHMTLVEQVKEMIQTEDNQHSREMLKQRLARLTDGVVEIRVATGPDATAEERADRYDDCIRAMITAIKTGVVRGGGAAYLSAAYQLQREEVDPLDQERKVARELIEAALITPFNIITTNALNYIPRINGRQLVDETNLTVDVWSGQFINAMEHGILDPLGVQTAAIRNAVKAATVFINVGGMFQNVHGF